MTLGASILEVEVTNVSKHGFWLWLGDEELFVPFAEFPWFKDASIGKLLNVERPRAHHLNWPDLDIDLAVDSIRHPERFPLSYRASATERESGSGTWQTSRHVGAGSPGVKT